MPSQKPSSGSPMTGAGRALRPGNRLGFYLHLSMDQEGLWEAIRQVQPPVILIHADTANRMLLQEIRAFRAPDALVIGRLYKDGATQRSLLENGDPAANGRGMADEILNYDFGLATQRGSNGRLLIDAWMSLNEAVPGPASRQFTEQPEQTTRLLAAYNAFQVAFRARLQEAGVEAVAFNFGAGNFAEPAHYLDYFGETLESYTYLGFHEYGWPTLYPAEGSATSAGLYRSCMAGIRARYGERHRVVITEAGLARMYQNPTAGDVGWLNPEQTLDQDQYWQSLAWYNDLLLQDDYVVGACLFEVGHHGNWATFRHLGQDNSGQPLRVVERIAGLAAGTRGIAPVAVPAPEVSPPVLVTLRGVVRAGGKPVAGAKVRLVGGQETLGTVRGAALADPGAVCWTRRVDTVEGSLWGCWRTQVEGRVAGLSWREFREAAPVYNPSLGASHNRLERGRTYLLPENVQSPGIVWDRPLTGFAGSIWACWQRYGEGKVAGLRYADFKQGMVVANPSLAGRGARLEAAQRYNLPRNEGHKEYVLVTESDRRGRFRYPAIPLGPYRLEVAADGYLPYRFPIEANGEGVVEVTLEPVIPALGVALARGLGPVTDFVRVHGSEFVAGDRTLRFVGANIRGIVHYGDGRTLPAAQEVHRREQVAAARDLGMRVIRCFLPSEHADTDQVVARLESLIALVKEEAPGLYLLPVFCNLYRDTPFRIPGDDGFYARVDPNFGIELLNADFFGVGYRQRYLPFVQSLVQRFRNEPVIFAWEVGNELKLNPAAGSPAGDPNVAAFIQFMLVTARTIRQLDPNHLVTTGMISTHHAWLHTDELRRQLYAGPEFDFLTVHCYNDELENDDSGLAQALGKPFIIEEAGYSQRFGPDRSPKVNEDLARWFGRGARGYMPWGFMATGDDIGDGDRDSGLDRRFHGDWDALVALLRGRAHELAQAAAAAPPRPAAVEAVEPKPASAPKFHPGQTVFALEFTNVRRSPGHVNKPGDDVLGMLAPGATATVAGEAVAADGLTWWPVQGTLSNGQTVDGWAAAALPDLVLLSAQAPGARGVAARPRGVSRVSPPMSTPRAVAASRGLGQTVYAQTYVNLRRSPGYVGKPSDDVLGQLPAGAPVEQVGGPQPADALTWWQVRGPLLDNTVAMGWAAEVDPGGQTLLAAARPAPPSGPAPAHATDFRPGEALAVLNPANLRMSAAFRNQAPEHVLAALPRGATGSVVAGPQSGDDLEWWELALVQGERRLDGWMAITAPDGTRLLASAAAAAALRIVRPFVGQWTVSQGWGAAPDFYAQFLYDGVPLKGHNGLDFATPPGTPILAVDAGEVIRADFEPDGFGYFVLLRHRWGESLYAHLERIDVAFGAALEPGQPLGLSGESGKSFGAHLHFGIRIVPYTRTDGWGGFVNPVPHMAAEDLLFSRALVRPSPMAPELPGRPRP